MNLKCKIHGHLDVNLKTKGKLLNDKVQKVRKQNKGQFATANGYNKVEAEAF